jgi:hypothetical protein
MSKKKKHKTFNQPPCAGNENQNIKKTILPKQNMVFGDTYAIRTASGRKQVFQSICDRRKLRNKSAMTHEKLSAAINPLKHQVQNMTENELFDQYRQSGEFLESLNVQNEQETSKDMRNESWDDEKEDEKEETLKDMRHESWDDKTLIKSAVKLKKLFYQNLSKFLDNSLHVGDDEEEKGEKESFDDILEIEQSSASLKESSQNIQERLKRLQQIGEEEPVDVQMYRRKEEEKEDKERIRKDIHISNLFRKLTEKYPDRYGDLTSDRDYFDEIYRNQAYLSDMSVDNFKKWLKATAKTSGWDDNILKTLMLHAEIKGWDIERYKIFVKELGEDDKNKHPYPSSLIKSIISKLKVI